jgi:hypothetical protein
MRRPHVKLAALVLPLLSLAAATEAGVPFPPNCECVVAITQNPVRLPCINNFEPDVARLCPAGDFDLVNITVVIRDANGDECEGVFVSATERTGIVNLANGGMQTSTTGINGEGFVNLTAASGYGLVTVCADGVALCDVEVRSPDVNKGSLPSLCGLGTSASSVNGSDITNPVCGFLIKFGTVTPGINDGWDLNCTNTVNGLDVNGAGSINAHFGDAGTLGAKNTCP